MGEISVNVEAVLPNENILSKLFYAYLLSFCVETIIFKDTDYTRYTYKTRITTRLVSNSILSLSNCKWIKVLFLFNLEPSALIDNQRWLEAVLKMTAQKEYRIAVIFLFLFPTL